MGIVLSIALIIICVLLVLVVLMQNSKGGGISSDFSAANQIIGVNRGADFIEKTTWTLAGVMLVVSLLLAPKVSSNANTQQDGTESTTRKKSANAAMPQAPVNPNPPAQNANPQAK